ncbi:MAG: hypothetical protein V4671_15345 [Armatimonadota bacterium]
MTFLFHKQGQRLATMTVLTALTGVLLSQTVFAAQPPQGGGPGGPGGPGGFRGPGGPGGPGGRRGGPRPVSLSTIPVKELASALLLSDSQVAKIRAIQESVQAERQTLMPPPGQQPDGPPSREMMDANREKMRSLDQKAAAQIEAVLTAEQKSAAPELLKVLNALGQGGVPLEVFADLKLTAAQKQQLAALPSLPPPPRPGDNGGAPPDREGMEQGRRQAGEKVMAILTEEQRKIVEAFRQAHPRPRPGDGGGPPRPGDGFGPPPGGGDGAPPPPPFN